jgi:hypothetical protein
LAAGRPRARPSHPCSVSDAQKPSSWLSEALYAIECKRISEKSKQMNSPLTEQEGEGNPQG